MIFFKESLYGWGVCDIPMPRSSHDIFADRRRRNASIPGGERRRKDDIRIFLASISGMITHDIPWSQTVSVMVVSLLSIFAVFFISKLVPVIPEKKTPEPVGITINVLHRVEDVRSEPETPAPEIKDMNMTSLRKPEDTETARIRGIQTDRNREPVFSEVPPSIEEKLPEPAIRPQHSQNLRYRTALIARHERESPLRRPISGQEHRFVQIDHEPLRDIPDNKMKYGLKGTVPAVDAPLPEAGFFGGMREVPPDSGAHVDMRVELKAPEKITTVSVLPAPSGRPGSFWMNRESQDSLILPEVKSGKIIARHARPDREAVHGVPVGGDHFSPEHEFTEEKIFASSSLPEADHAVRRYGLSSNRGKNYLPLPNEDEDGSRFSVSPGEIMFQERKPGLRPFMKAVSSAGKGGVESAKVRGQAHEFPEDISIDEIDPSYLVSLKELAVCADPEEEFRLKTKLAVLLHGPAKCMDDNMVFFFRYPESGYTIQVLIYNPGEKPLEDRCSILRSAIDCIRNKRTKGAD